MKKPTLIRKRLVSNRQEGLELSNHQQWERIFWCLFVAALILSLNISILLLLFDHGYVRIQKTVLLTKKEVVGFPKPQLALISNTGMIQTFGLSKNGNLKLPKLPEQDLKGFPVAYFGVYYKNSIYFLSCNPKRLVLQFSLEDNLQTLIPDSGIPNEHLLYSKGTQVGKYFWIFDGMIGLGSHGGFCKLQTQDH